MLRYVLTTLLLLSLPVRAEVPPPPPIEIPETVPVTPATPATTINPENSFTPSFAAGWEADKKGHYTLALRHYLPLAEQGHANAQYNLGVMYELGHGVKNPLKRRLSGIKKPSIRVMQVRRKT